MDLSIDKFWRPRLSALQRPSTAVSAPGWTSSAQATDAFIEPPLSLRGDEETLSSPIWFVSAPGAVGKSTLARHLAALTNAVYIDLARAATVGGDSLAGGLLKNGLYSLWTQEKTTVFIDALDEARLRVTQKSFEDFLDDVLSLSIDRKIPTIIFGRSGIVTEAVEFFALKEINCPVFDIGYFSHDNAAKFIRSKLDQVAKGDEGLRGRLSSHAGVYHEVIEKFLAHLESAVGSDGQKFSGYAPVLEAIALVIAPVSNPAHLKQEEAAASQEGDILHSIVDRIQKREAEKFRSQLPNDIRDKLGSMLYGPDEQFAGLAAKIYHLPAPNPSAALPAVFLAEYQEKIESFLSQHPFLDGSGMRSSGAVFSAAINAAALFSDDQGMLVEAERAASAGPNAPNPFLFDFYRKRAVTDASDEMEIRPEHVVFLYESLAARMPIDHLAELSIEADDGDESAEVEIEIKNISNAEEVRRIKFKTSQLGELRFGRNVESVFVDAPDLDLRIGIGGPVEVVAPVSFVVANVFFECPELAVSARGKRADYTEDNIVFIEGSGLKLNKIIGPPVLRGDVRLAVSWPAAKVYPWTAFVSPGSSDDGKPEVDELLRSLRRLVMAFRSHSKGQLARYADKIEHGRMTKGELGIRLREKLLNDGVIAKSGKMYTLNSSALGKKTGVTYADLKVKSFNHQVRSYVATLLD